MGGREGGGGWTAARVLYNDLTKLECEREIEELGEVGLTVFREISGASRSHLWQ